MQGVFRPELVIAKFWVCRNTQNLALTCNVSKRILATHKFDAHPGQGQAGQSVVPR
jgi:hypothetical protein